MVGNTPAQANGDDMTPTIDPEAFIGTTYATQAGPLLGRLTRITRDPFAAEDLVQETFVRLVVEVRAGRTPSDPGAWLYRVGHNLAMSRGRRMSVADRRQGELPRPGDAPSPEVLAVESEQHMWLRAAVAELGATDRHAIVLSANGVGGPEIARSIGRSDAATRTLLCRARTKIRGRLLQAAAG
jgi:RNA polymerase sigma-70 factor (ECF subfamily)